MEMTITTLSGLIVGFSAGMVFGVFVGWFLSYQVAKAYSNRNNKDGKNEI